MILDSNILIYAIEPAFEALRQYLRANEGNLKISLITKLEVLGFHKLTAKDKLALEELIHAFTILPLNELVIEEAIRIRQQKKRSLGDSIIAATALVHDMPLLTNNVEDFQELESLQIIDMQLIR